MLYRYPITVSCVGYVITITIAYAVLLYFYTHFSLLILYLVSLFAGGIVFNFLHRYIESPYEVDTELEIRDGIIENLKNEVDNQLTTVTNGSGKSKGYRHEDGKVRSYPQIPLEQKD